MGHFPEQALKLQRGMPEASKQQLCGRCGSYMIYARAVHSTFWMATFKNRLFAGSEILYSNLTYLWKATHWYMCKDSDFQYIVTGWWFGTFVIFPSIGNNHPNCRTHIFQRGRSTTNQVMLCSITKRYL